MTFEEAMRLVDAGHIVAQESGWVMCVAGFAWGPWVERKRAWSDDDLMRMQKRDKAWTKETNPPPIEPTGRWYRAFCTLCESVEISPEAAPFGDDWVDVTDRFTNGSPKGYAEHHYAQT